MVPRPQFDIFICTNEIQRIGAKISRFSILKNEPWIDHSHVHILEASDRSEIQPIFGKAMKDGDGIRFINQNDMQSFSLLRFLPPSKQKFSGISLIIDPDVFSVKPGLKQQLDAFESSNCAISARRSGNGWASSVMFTNNAKLAHWDFENIIAGLEKHSIDYRELMGLQLEKNGIGELPIEYNSFDELKNDTVLLHTTNRITQPWRVGLKFESHKKIKPVLGVIPRKIIWKLLGRPTWEFHEEHPVKRITAYFFKLAAEARAADAITDDEIKEAQKSGEIRPDFIDQLNAYSN